MRSWEGLEHLRIDRGGREPVCFARFATLYHLDAALKKLQAIRCAFYGKVPYMGNFYSSEGCTFESRFLVFNSNVEAENYYYLVGREDQQIRRQKDTLLCYHPPIYHHDNEWLIPIEKSETVQSFFETKNLEWNTTRDQTLSQIAMRTDWFNYIRDRFTEIFRDVARIWRDLIIDDNATDIYTNSAKESLWVDKHGIVKILPKLNFISSETAVDGLCTFMIDVISSPFGESPDYCTRVNSYRLGLEIQSFLDALNVQNLMVVNYVGTIGIRN
ncbi:hypothetical protein V6N13_084470 [Hibiscus sabdariffa]